MSHSPEKASTLTLYTTPHCPACRLTRDALDRAGVAYTIVDLSEHPELLAQLRKEGLAQAPVIDDGEARTGGFRPDRIKSIIAAASPALSTYTSTPIAQTAAPAQAPTQQGRSL